MIQSWGWKQKSNRIVLQDNDKKSLEKRLKGTVTRMYKPVMVQGKPMEIKEHVDFAGNLYYVIVLERIVAIPEEVKEKHLLR